MEQMVLTLSDSAASTLQDVFQVAAQWATEDGAAAAAADASHPGQALSREELLNLAG